MGYTIERVEQKECMSIWGCRPPKKKPTNDISDDKTDGGKADVCNFCGGNGNGTWDKKCPVCNGSGIKKEQDKVEEGGKDGDLG